MLDSRTIGTSGSMEAFICSTEGKRGQVCFGLNLPDNAASNVGGN
jgi:hypothetical protein